jgi:hypothetical protein
MPVVGLKAVLDNVSKKPNKAAGIPKVRRRADLIYFGANNV